MLHSQVQNVGDALPKKVLTNRWECVTFETQKMEVSPRNLSLE